MRNQDLTYEDVLRIVELVKTTRFSEFRLKVGEVEVHLRRSNGAAPGGPQGVTGDAVPAVQLQEREKEKQFPHGSVLVRAPMVGTFYRAPAPGAAPFVEVGQHVEPDATVCIIEVMKLMNSIEAGVRGTVRQIVVENAAAVEAGEVLVAIEPA